MFEFFQNLMSGGSGTTIGPGSMSHMSPDQWGTQVQGGSTEGGGIAGLLADPNIQSLMAGVGANLVPEGVGGAIGKPTQAMIQNKQMGKAMEKQDARWKAVIDAIGTGSVGKATIKEDGKGGTTMTLGAPEGGLGTLNQPTQQQQDPMQSLAKNFTDFFASMGIKLPGGM